MRQVSRYSVGGIPTVRVNRSKNAERESAAARPSWTMVHGRATSSCSCRIAGASRVSANPRNSPAGAIFGRRCPGGLDEQYLYQAREHELLTRPRFARFLADEAHQRQSRSKPRTWITAGSNDPSKAPSGVSKTK